MNLRNFSICSVLAMGMASVSAQSYQVGDIMTNFTLIDRGTGQTVNLYDFEGQVLFFDFFAVWCPFCVAAAPDIDSGVVQYYTGTGANSNGLPVQRVGMNLQADTAFYKPRTDSFVSEHAITPVLQDTSREVANQFVSGAQPIFVVVNGVANSPTHAQWEILLIVDNYGSFATPPIASMRAAIDSVAAPVLEPPTPVRLIGSEPASPGMLRLRIEGNRRDEIILRRSDDLTTWTNLDTAIPSDAEEFVELTLATLAGDRFVQAVRAE